MLVSEEFLEIKVDQGEYDERAYGIGKSEPYEPYTDDLKRLFRDYQKEYGRCTGSVFIDTKDGKTKRIGWVFRKRVLYSDARTEKDTFLREVWVTLYDAQPEKHISYHYHAL